MSLQGLYDTLRAALHDGSIDLTATTAPGLGAVLEPLGLPAPGGTLGLRSATLALSADAVILAGTAAWRDATWVVTVTGRASNGTNAFTAELRGPAGWRFETSFRGLPRTRRAQRGTLQLGPSVIEPLALDTPIVTAQTGAPRATLAGRLSLARSELERYDRYLGTAPLQVSGPVDLSVPSAPRLELAAVAPAANTAVPNAAVAEMGLLLDSHYRDTAALDESWMSTAALFARVPIGGEPATLSAPLLQGDNVWPLSVRFASPRTLSGGIRGVMQLLGTQDASLFVLPDQLAALDAFGISGFQLGVVPPASGRGPGLSYAGISVQSTRAWNPPIPFVVIKEVGTGWVLKRGDGELFVSGTVWGILDFFDKVSLRVEVALPTFDVFAGNEEPIAIPLEDLLKTYLGGSTGLLPRKLTIEEVNLQASPRYQTYQASLLVTNDWPLTIGDATFNLTKVMGELRSTQSKVSGSVQGIVAFDVPPEPPSPAQHAAFMVGAEYDGQEGIWRFFGGLVEGKLDVLGFAFALLGRRPGVEVPAIELTALLLSYETSEDRPMSASGALKVRWTPTLLGQTLSLEASAQVTRRRQLGPGDHARALALPEIADGSMIYEGAVSGTFRVNQLRITAGLSFVGREKTYLLEVAWREAMLRAATQWTGVGPARHEVLAISIHGVTVGQIVEYLVGLANPNANYRLEPPWDFLNKIDLTGLTVTIDPTLQTIALSYPVTLDLGFVSLSSLGIVYDRKGGRGSVQFALTCRLLGQQYGTGGKPPLKWDPVNDPPPRTAGGATRLFDLRYLGMGQHVSLRDPPRTLSVLDYVVALRKEMQPVSGTANPLTQSRLRFDPSSEWMVGFDATVLDTVSVAMIMHDPDIYGIVVALGGPRAKSLSGLKFELLYRKVTDDIGVFRVRLQIPEAFRQLNFGAVAITLGVITVDVFTNGNFMVDLGFPHNRDFKDSFGLQASIFIGAGGLYFGLLNGATSSRVPAITNGTFDPVIAAGVGLQAGVGRTFEKGPLKAGAYVQIVAIVEGVIGFFQPTDKALAKDTYFWIRGTLGIVGKIYGEVDFKVISVEISIEAHAFATFTIEAYEPSQIELDVAVRVTASIKIVFIRIHFSFGLQLRMAFTIGSRSTPPWRLSPDQRGRGSRALLESAAVPRHRDPARIRAITRESFRLARFGATDDPAYVLHWPTDRNVFPDGRTHPVAVKMLPAYTVDAVPVAWPDAGTPGADAESDAYRIAFLLMVDNGVPPETDTIEETRKLQAETSATARTPLATPLNAVVEGMLRWSLAALGVDPVTGAITAGALEELAAQLDLPEAADDLDLHTLEAFLTENLQVQVSGIPEGEEPAPTSGTAFPIPPPLAWTQTVPVDEERDFAAFREIDATYEREVREYFAELRPRGNATVRATGTGDEVESMASFVFRDWFLMVAKIAVQAALDVMASFPYVVRGDESIDDVCALFPPVTVAYEKREGDTVEDVARRYARSVAEILALNPGLADALRDADPGTDVPVRLGTTPESVVTANPDWPLNAGVEVDLGVLVHQVRERETLAGIASRLGADLDAWLATSELLDTHGLLCDGAALELPVSAFANPGKVELDLVAAVLFVRLRGTADLHEISAEGIPLVEWFVEAIAQLNEIDVDGLPPVVRVPRAFEQLDDPLEWHTLAGDTLWDIAAYVAIWSSPTTTPGFEAWRARVRELNPDPDLHPIVLVPSAPTAVRPGETLAALAARLPFELAEGESIRQFAARHEVLVALRPLRVPGCVVHTAEDQTLGAFGALYDLSADETGRRVAGVDGLLARDLDRELAVPHPSSAPIGGSTAAPGPSDLVATVLGRQGATIAGQVSRFMLHGLRMPAPKKGEDGRYHAVGDMTGLYELVGQQLTGPAPAPRPGEPSPTRLELAVRAAASATWLQLYASATLAGDERVAGRLLHLNPGLPHRDELRGLVALTEPVDKLVFAITEADLAGYPATALAPQWLSGPRALQPYRDVPVRHDLQHRLLWQTASPVTLPNPDGVPAPVTGNPTIWPFPGDLVAAARRHPDSAFALRSVDPQLGPSAPPVDHSRFAWATMVDVAIRRIPGRPNTSELLGADTASRGLLLDLWRYLEHPEPGDGAQLHVLFRPSSAAGLPTGLGSAPLDPARTYLVKTNLSTETHSGPATSDEATAGAYYASIADAREFLTLAWECSVVGGGGYWLEYTAADGSPLPESIFGTDGTAQLSLLVLLTLQSTGPAPSRTLHPFTTCAVLGESVDAGSASLYAEAAGAVETGREPTLQPGNAAFGMRLAKPAVEAADKETVLRQLYGLLAYRLKDGVGFDASHEGMPIGPGAPPQPLGPHEEASDDDVWDVFQVVPLHRYAHLRPLPVVDGLPDPGDDPYAGIAFVDSPAGPLAPSTQVELRFREVLGNASRGEGDAASGGPELLDVPAGYSDAVIGVSAWPATTSWFEVRGGAPGGGATLRAAIALQSATHVAGAAERATEGAATARAQLGRFADVYFQLMRPDVEAALLTTLEAGDEGPARIAVPRQGLRDFAAAACAWLGSAARLADVLADVATCRTLAELSDRCGVGYDGIAAANADVPLEHIVAPDCEIPAYAVFRDGESVATLVRGAGPALLEQWENAALLLRPGVELVVTPWRYAVPDQLPSPTLELLAESTAVSIAALVAANKDRAGILAPGFVFACEGVEVTVAGDESLDDVAMAFAAKGVPYDALMVAGANAERPGMFRTAHPAVELVVDRHTALEGDSLAHNSSGEDLSYLAEHNLTTVDLFGAGAPVFTGARPAAAVLGRPLSEAAETYDLEPSQLLSHNRDVALAKDAGEHLAVPGQAMLPDDAATLRVPFRIPPAATLDDVAARFLDATPLGLAEANLELPGVLAGGQTVDAGGQQVQTRDGDSFAALRDRFDPQVPLADIVAAIGSTAGYLETGALLLCPPGLVPNGSRLRCVLREAAERFGLDPATLAVANAALAGLVAPGVEVEVRREDGTPVQLLTGAADTFNGLVWRFGAAGVVTTVAEIAARNADRDLLVPGAPMLLPPPAAVLEAEVGGDGWRFPGTIFPLRAWVEIARDPDLVLEPFRGTPEEPGRAVRDRTVLPPYPAPLRDEDRALGLQRFAEQLETAIDVLRVATGTPRGAAGAPDATDAWAVAFGAGHIEQLTVEPKAAWPGHTERHPEFYALRPLDNALVSRKDIPIAPLDPDGTLGDAVPTDYQGIDLEAWAQRFLADVDLFLSAPYAAATYRSARRSMLDKAIAAKATLAAGIVKGLDRVLDTGLAGEDEALASAAETLRQRLLVGLGAGYTTAVVVQYGATVRSPWTAEQARLSGTGTLPPDPTGELDRTGVSGAKVSLKDGSSSVNFLLTVAEEGEQRAVRLPLTFSVTELESDVAEVAAGYESSTWLRFVRDFGAHRPPGVSFDLGTPDAPLPLRAYPPLPALLGQASRPTTPEPADYAEALRWDYAFTFQHQSMAPDRMRLTVEFNRPPLVGTNGSGDDDLVARLAQYVAVAPQLWELLGRLPDGAQEDPAVLNAIATFATLAEEIGDRWGAHWGPPPPPPPHPQVLRGPAYERYVYVTTLDAAWDAERRTWMYDALYLTREEAGGPLGWPVMGCVLPDGTLADMGPGEDTDRGRRYPFPRTTEGGLVVEAFRLLAMEARFTHLHIASYQRANAEIQVTRNAQLLDDGPPTRSGFVYQTQTLAFPSAVTPLLSWEEAFAIGRWDADPERSPLRPVFEEIFDHSRANRRIDCAIRYGYELGGSGDERLVTYLPARYRPKFDFEDGTVAQIATAVVDWARDEDPVTEGGEWVFGVSLYSSVEGDLERPLLELRRLSSHTGA